MKKILSMLLVLTFIIQVVPFAKIDVSAYSVPSDISQNKIASKAKKLVSALGGDGAYFNCDRSKGCGEKSWGHGCDNCNVVNIIGKKWFKNIFGAIEIWQLPPTVKGDGSLVNYGAWSQSCQGFARFAEWYLFHKKETDQVSIKTVCYNQKFSKSKFDKYAKPGDMIAMGQKSSSTHYGIYISHDSSTVTILDCNSLGSHNCQVHMRNYEYNSTVYPYFALARAKNSVTTISIYDIVYKANGGSGAPSSQKKSSDSDLTLSSQKPTRDGYIFLGWSTNSKATTPTYQPGGKFTSNANTTLYAVWEKLKPYSGECGQNVNWSFDEESGVLMITGSGRMNDYSSAASIPWNPHFGTVKSVVVEEGVEYVGRNAFYNCSVLSLVTLLHGVTGIGDTAFKNCGNLTSITIPDSVTSIGSGVFKNCGYFTIYCNPASPAESFATENGLGYSQIQPSESVLLNKTEITLNVGKTATLTATMQPSETTDIVIWSSSDSNVVKVSDGKVTAVKAGAATITAKTTSGKTATCTVNVKLSVPSVTVTNTSKGVSVKWSAAPGADGYIVYRKKSASSAFAKLATVKGGSVVSYTDAKAKGNTEYIYTVGAYKGSTNGDYNKTGKTVLFLSAPTTKVANKNGYINVSWSKITGAKGYVIYKKTGSGSYKKLTTIKSGSTVSYKDKSVKSGTKYSYYVKAYNGSTYSGYKSGVTTMYLAPVKISSAVSGKKGITVKWGKISASNGYTVYRKTGSGKYAKLATVKGATKISYLDKSAKKGKTYTYYAVAYNGSYTGTYANKKSCKDKY